MTASIKVFFLAAEAEPFQKVGGLADVAGSLPLALRNLVKQDTGKARIDVRLVLPLHKSTKINFEKLHPVDKFKVVNREGGTMAKVYQMPLKEMLVYFIDGDPISSAETIYSDDFASDREKYAFFSLAALDLLDHIDWQPDIIHANDWHTALALFALKLRRSTTMTRISTLLTVHNLPYMGGDASDVLSSFGLVPPVDDLLPHWARTQPLPLGLWAADAIVPVSPTYAEEILTSKHGCGLETFLGSQKRRITGILNGLDLISYDPACDKNLSINYDINELKDRAGNKKALQNQLGLPEAKDIPVIAMVGRIDHQKGVDLAIQVLEKIHNRSWQFILLGSGNKDLENSVQSWQYSRPDRIRGVLRYDPGLARHIYAGADMFLMPSRYEPCGLAQMIAMRYGCVPVVSATGGLKDTVRDGDTGFLFEADSNQSICETLLRALSVFTTQKELWRDYQYNGMLQDFSWSNSARKYADIYQSLLASDTT